MVHSGVFALVMASLMLGAPAQRSPYQGSSDPGVLPQYLPQGTEDRFGGGAAASAAVGGGSTTSVPTTTGVYDPPKLHGGTLETQDVYNRVSQWPDEHKPFWYLNAMAIQAQRDREQQQQQAAAAAAASAPAAQRLDTQNRNAFTQDQQSRPQYYNRRPYTRREY